MHDGELMANLAATARAFRVLAVIAAGLASFAHEAVTQERVHRIGIVQGVEDAAVRALPDALRARGYDVGRNLQIEVRSAQDQFDRIPALVAELVALHPDIIVAASPQTALAVHTIAPEIPLLFLTVADPVGIGLVPNLAQSVQDGGLMSYGPNLGELGARAHAKSTMFLRVRNRVICRLSNQRSSTWSSISRQPRRLASPSPPHCSSKPPRLLNDVVLMSASGQEATLLGFRAKSG